MGKGPICLKGTVTEGAPISWREDARFDTTKYDRRVQRLERDDDAFASCLLVYVTPLPCKEVSVHRAHPSVIVDDHGDGHRLGIPALFARTTFG